MSRNNIRVLLIAPDPAFGSMQFVVESVKVMTSRRWHIDLLVPELHSPPFCYQHESLRVVMFGSLRIKGLYRVSLLAKALFLGMKGRYDVVIGVSQTGLLIGDAVRRLFGGSSVFYNDELWLGNERATTAGKLLGAGLKCLERVANSKCILTVTQDRWRARLLRVLNRVESASIRVLPNAGRGQAKSSERDFALHDELGIRRKSKIVLWLGTYSEGCGAIELAERVEELPADCVYVFHARSRSTTAYMRALDRRADGQRVFVSRRQVDYDAVERLVRSATVGLGLYRDKGVNSRCMYYASGRINAFLRCAIPCVVSDFVGFRWIERRKAGVCVDGVEAVGRAVERIIAEYAEFQASAARTYNDVLNAEQPLNDICVELEGHVLKAAM